MVCADEVEALFPRPAGGQDPGSPAVGALRGSRLLTGARLKQALAERARCLGFDAFGVTGPDAIPQARERLAAFLDAGHHGDMDWMARAPQARADPRALWPEVASIVMLGMTYAPDDDPLDDLSRRSQASLSVYARRRDYHEVIKGRLKELAGLLAKAGAQVKVFVDTAPVMEKPLAAAAGLGWQGKHTVLVSRAHGSWLFLGAIFTDAALPPDAPGRDHCGSCRRCLDICPTGAFPAPYRLDATKCLAYWSIEHKGHIPVPMREAMGNRVFGCDDCLAACPWNRFAAASRDAKLGLREDLARLPLADLARLDDAAFRKLFAGTPIRRTGRDRFVRNVAIAIGNAGDPGLVPVALDLARDASPLVRAAAAWALSRLVDADALRRHAAVLAADEADEAVRAEWAGALSVSSPIDGRIA
jgi:epoxyqueuosine reductase